MVRSTGREATEPHPLRVARLHRGLSQEALAVAVGVERRVIIRAERGAPLRPDTIRRLVRYLKRSPEALGLLPELHAVRTHALAERVELRGPASEVAGSLRNVLVAFSSVDNLTGPGSLLSAVPAQLAVVEHLLSAAPAAVRGALLDVAARCAELAGWVHQDAGDLRMADQWTARAADYALGSGDPRLMSYVLMRRSNVASDAEDADRALALAQAALRDGDRLTPQLRAVALRQEAHAHALRGDATACARALDRAMAEVVAPAPGEAEFDLTGYCTPGYIGMEAAACWLQLGQPKQAIATFENRLSTWPAGFKRDLGLCLARLAVAHAAHRELEHASAVGQRAVGVVREARSARALRELARLDTLLGEWKGASEATEVRRALRTLLPSATPATGTPRAPTPEEMTRWTS